MSDKTAHMLEGALPLRQVDRVIVKGKTEAVDIFTFSDNTALNELTRDALRAYWDQRWDESEELWQRLLLAYPEDKIATIYLDRISVIREMPPGADWNSAVALDKL